MSPRGTRNRVVPVHCFTKPLMKRATRLEADQFRALNVPSSAPATHMSNVLQCHLLQGKSTVNKSNESLNAQKAT